MSEIEKYYKDNILGKPYESKKEIIIQEKDRKEIKELIPYIINNAKSYEKIGLIQIIKENPELGTVEQYLSNFLSVNPGEILNGNVEKIIGHLIRLEEVNKTILLEAIANNIEGILSSFKSIYSIEILDFLGKLNTLLKDVEHSEGTKKSLVKIEQEISNQGERILEQYDYEIYLIQELRKFNIDTEILKKHQEDIVKKISGAMLLRYMESCKQNEGFKQKWDYYEFSQQLLKHDRDIIKDKISIAMVSKFIEEICEHEEVKIADIECAGEGHYSFSLKIGEFVLKIGKERAANYIPSDKRIIKPLIRQQTNIEGKEDIPNLFIEIQNVVDTNWYKDLSEEEIKEELYKIYKELRERGKVWTDVKPENVGKLLKPNKENFVIDGEELKSNNYAISFTGEETEEILQRGELVIIDTDYIFLENDKNKRIAAVGYQKEFEKRWKNEKDMENAR